MRHENRLTLTSHVMAFAPDTGIGPELKCPRCSSHSLHHGRVTVFDREEDNELTTVTTVNAGLSATHLRPSTEVRNPSLRRDGIAIAFDCEECGDGIELTIAQHKGVTAFAWRFEPKTPTA
jgi:DNA-directed RNA polymerase subunit RPC12/RpoP